MNEPLKPAAIPADTNQARVEATATASASVSDADTAPLEQASALLLKLGPVEALRVLSAMRDAVAKAVRAQNGDAEVAHVWRSSSEGMAKLAASLGGPRGTAAAEAPDDDDQDGQGDDEDEAEGDDDNDEEAPEDSESTARAPRKERAKMRRMVAGMFDVAPRVNVCRLREVNEMGGRGELVGRVNEQGIEQTEWPLALMTAERLQNLTRHRGGKYMFEWFGRDENGARAALGRSPAFKVQGEKKQADPPAASTSAAPTSAAAQTELMTAILAMQKHSDERADRERERYDREKEREHELRKHRESLASKERIERLSQQTRLAELQAEAAAEAPPPGPSGPHLNEAAIAAYLERLVSDRFARVPAPTATANPADELGIPKWMQEVGVNKDLLTAAKPFLKEQLANLPSFLAKMGVQGGPIATPTSPTSPYPAVSNVSRFVPKGGTGG